MTHAAKMKLFLSLLIAGVVMALSASHIKNEKAEKGVWLLGYGLIIFAVLMAAYNASTEPKPKKLEK